LSLVLLAPLVALIVGLRALRAFRRERWRAFLPLALLAVATMLEVVLKATLVHPGPPYELARARLPEWLHAISPELGNSYPSGHALRAAFLLGLALGGPRRIVVPLALGAAATALSRVYAADHWPSDVLGGIALGLAAALFATPACAFVGTISGDAPRHDRPPRAAR
jgi:undecaprenyl-diphosphatase